MLVREDVEHGTAGEVGAVPDRLHPGYISLSFQERRRLGPTA